MQTVTDQLRHLVIPGSGHGSETVVSVTECCSWYEVSQAEADVRVSTGGAAEAGWSARDSGAGGGQCVRGQDPGLVAPALPLRGAQEIVTSPPSVIVSNNEIYF